MAEPIKIGDIVTFGCEFMGLPAGTEFVVEIMKLKTGDMILGPPDTSIMAYRFRPKQTPLRIFPPPING